MADEAVRTYGEVENRSGQVDGLILMGRALAASGEAPRAAQAWQSARELIDSPADPRLAILDDLLDSSGDRPIPTPRNGWTTPATRSRPSKKNPHV